ncbi:Uncharacterised protein [Staphylococcus aureus]|nr:Uncharacterised protein [Staphylococcus aureus]
MNAAFLPAIGLPNTIPTPSCEPKEQTVPRSTYSNSSVDSPFKMRLMFLATLSPCCIAICAVVGNGRSSPAGINAEQSPITKMLS